MTDQRENEEAFGGCVIFMLVVLAGFVSGAIKLELRVGSAQTAVAPVVTR